MSCFTQSSIKCDHFFSPKNKGVGLFKRSAKWAGAKFQVRSFGFSVMLGSPVAQRSTPMAWHTQGLWMKPLGDKIPGGLTGCCVEKHVKLWRVELQGHFLWLKAGVNCCSLNWRKDVSWLTVFNLMCARHWKARGAGVHRPVELILDDLSNTGRLVAAGWTRPGHPFPLWFEGLRTWGQSTACQASKAYF